MQVFGVEGMTCGHCARAVTEAVQSEDPGAKVSVDLAGRQVSVESQLSPEQIARLIKEQGYSIIGF